MWSLVQEIAVLWYAIALLKSPEYGAMYAYILRLLNNMQIWIL